MNLTVLALAMCREGQQDGSGPCSHHTAEARSVASDYERLMRVRSERDKAIDDLLATGSYFEARMPDGTRVAVPREWSDVVRD